VPELAKNLTPYYNTTYKLPPQAIMCHFGSFTTSLFLHCHSGAWPGLIYEADYSAPDTELFLLFIRIFYFDISFLYII
jgi:hypothetical protein